ncbi:hypothetical protein GCM10009760_35290 [Kitasatospora kazusensis]|uniref:HEAT repeat protein n=1 Tax=Kitasatospora kazusensis TaxID=407974 RepID=A0ABP5LEM1_9ACTN
MKWLDQALATGAASTPGHPSRTAIFDAVRAERTGPVATRLLRLSRDEDPLVRREVLDLLWSLGFGGPWPEAADAALARLTDRDAEVRRRAARLVVAAGRRDLALAALAELTDPVVRSALAEALGTGLAHLRADPLAAIRFRAHLETLRAAPPAQWPALDAALHADAREAALHWERLGQAWGRTLCGLGREQDTYAVTAGLLADPATRETGADLAREACHQWRAAPVELLPLLVRHCGPEPGPALARALTTASISEAAMRRHGALTATVPFRPYPKPRRPSCPAVPPAYDSLSAAGVLAARPVGIGRLGRAPEIFGALLDAGPLTFRQAAQLYNLTFLRPGATQARCVPLWLRHAGPAALPRLLALLVPHLGDYTIGEHYLACLARMGRQALPALPAVAALIDRRTRIPANDSTRDAEMRLDELLLAAALAARRAILAAPAVNPAAR